MLPTVLLNLQKVFIRKNIPNTTFSVVRTLLSSINSLQDDFHAFTSPCPGFEEMSAQILPIDRCHERFQPVSSAMIDRAIRAIDDNDHLKGSLYYLYKFRHSPNGFYLHPWTTFAFASKCLKIDANVLLEALQQKVNYGIFPNSFIMNLVLDHFLKNDNIEGAVKTASEIFLLELLDSNVAQTLTMTAVSKFWKNCCQEGQILPDIEDQVTKRNVGGILLCVGIYTSNPSLVIIGNSLLGNIEMADGIRAVFQNPWAPLSTEEGYLNRAIDCLRQLKTPVSQQSIDILQACAADTSLNESAQAAIESARSNNLISNEEEFTIDGVASLLQKRLPEFEEKENLQFADEIRTWKADRDVYEEIEKDFLREFATARENRFREMTIDKEAHEMAVETLGFWDMAKDWKGENTESEKGKTDDDVVYYLRKDYVEGAMEDSVVNERFCEKLSIVDDSIALII